MFVLVLLVVSVTWHLSDATSCTSITGRTCKKTSFVAGTCSKDTCACAEGYEPVRTGCVAKVKPYVDIIASDGGNPENTAKGSGEVFEGREITLSCISSKTGPTFDWMKNSEELPGEVNSTLILTSVNFNHSGQYRCKVKVGSSDYVSEVSDPVTVTVITGGSSFKSRPVVTGMLNRAMVNGPISLQCTNIPSGVGLGFEWYVGGVNMNNSAKTYTLIMTDKTVSKDVTCKIVNVSQTVNASLTSPESTPVKTPSSLTDDITGVVILEAQGGTVAYVEVSQPVNLHSKIVDSDLAIDMSSVTYTWTKDGANVGQASTYELKMPATTDSGVYKCSVKVGNRPVKESVNLSVNVAVGIIGEVKVVLEPPKPLVGGYLSIQCIAQVRSLSKVIYLWNKNDVSIDGQRDSQIQINEVNRDDAGSYLCYAATELVIKSSGKSEVTANTIDAVAPDAPTTDKPGTDAFGVGNTYTLTCSNNHETPGMTYKWLEGGQVIKGATSKTYTVTAKSDRTLYSCQTVFNGTASKMSPSVTIDAKSIIRVTVELAGTTVSGTTIKPLNETTVTLECKVTKSASASGVVSYAWLKNDQVEQNQTTSTYEFIARFASDGRLKCRTTLGNEMVSSSDVTVVSVGTLEAPTLEVINTILVSGQLVYSEGASYTIVCKTASHTDTVVYTWLKNGTTIDGARARSYTISRAKKGKNGDSGVYTCKAALASSSVTSTNNIPITIGDPGLPCNYATECVGSQYGTSCVNGRCECARGYTANGNTCSGVGHVAASLFLLMLCAVISQWA